MQGEIRAVRQRQENSPPECPTITRRHTMETTLPCPRMWTSTFIVTLVGGISPYIDPPR